jgi:hypothetical protein
LHDDDEIVVPPPRASFSSASAAPIGSSVAASSSIGAASSVTADWSSPFATSGSIWGGPAVPALSVPVVTPPDRPSVIRDRAKVAWTKMDELGGSTKSALPVTDVHRGMLALWADSASVTVTEMVEAMLVEGNPRNGGGRFVWETSAADGNVSVRWEL